MQILIADDSLVSRHLLDATLRKWGYEVVIACDGAEAWGPESKGLQSVIWTDNKVFKVGDKIDVHYRIKSVGSANQMVWRTTFWPNNKIIVLDESGKEVEMTNAGKIGRADFSPGGTRKGRTRAITLKPGEVDELPTFDLTGFFVLTTPGKYTVQYIYEEDQKEGWKGRLESNKLQIAIMP